MILKIINSKNLSTADSQFTHAALDISNDVRDMIKHIFNHLIKGSLL